MAPAGRKRRRTPRPSLYDSDKTILQSEAMDSRLRTILAELRAYLAELYGERLVDVVLFGSQARGDAVEGIRS